jgi:DNA-binding response OmpR family regulator
LLAQHAISLNILVVEDNDSLRQATVDFLCEHGHLVTGVVCAEDVDDTPLGSVPDLYLIDVNLPGENGFSLAQRLRQAQPSAGIVLITARGQLQDRLQGYQIGADNYLIKPVEQAEMLACIKNLALRLKPPVRDSDLLLDGTSLCLRGPKGHVQVTQGEYLLLASLCRAAGNKLERWQAMQLIDPTDKGLVGANLEMRISVLRKKLTACGAPEDAIRTLRGYGYALSCAILLK